MSDAQIVSYLLGELEEEERARLEERFLRDVEYRELIRAVEDDLIDDYVRGELPPHQQELFEKQFASHPQRARKVELARALSRVLAERRHAAKEPIAFRKTRSSASMSAFGYPLAAAALVLLGIGIWLVMETRRSRPEGQQPQAEQQTPQPEQKPAPGNRAGQPPAQVSIATFVLPAGLVRDTTGHRTFAIPQGTQIVRLRLPLEKGDEYPSYRAELRTASGNSLWNSDSTPAQTDASGQTVVLEVPAVLLQPDRYELLLAGVNNAVAEEIGYYYFSLVRQ